VAQGHCSVRQVSAMPYPTPCCSVSLEGKSSKSTIDVINLTTEPKQRPKTLESGKLVEDTNHAVEWLMETYDLPALKHIVEKLIDLMPLLRVCLSEFALQPAGMLQASSDEESALRQGGFAEVGSELHPVSDTILAQQPKGEDIVSGSTLAPKSNTSDPGATTVQEAISSVFPNPCGHTSCPCVVMFGTKVFYAMEGDGPAEINVSRIGDASQTCSVDYKTKDASAVAGYKYTSTAGTLTFERDELTKKVLVPILSDERWDATLEFGVELSNPVNTHVCVSLSRCRVKVLDDDAFPTNKYRDVIEAGMLKDIPKMQLFREYVLANFKDPTIGVATFKVMAYDQLQNLYDMFCILLKLYLVDIVLDMETSEDHLLMLGMSRMLALGMITCLIMFPQMLICWISVKRTESRVGGMCRLKLQTNLVRKFLNYGEETRTSCSHSDLMLSITRHSPSVVKDGYLSIIVILRQLTKMLALLTCQVIVCIRQGQADTALVSVVPVVLFPVCMLSFLRFRHRTTHEQDFRMMVQEKQLATNVEMVTHKARMITDYQRRTRIMDTIEEEIRCLNQEINRSNVMHEVNRQFSPWLESLIVGAYVLLAGRQIVQGGGLSLGSFLTSVDIYRKVADSMEVIYNLTLIVQASWPALELIVWHMNLPTDLEKRYQMSLKRQALGEIERGKIRDEVEARRKRAELVYAIDLLPITLHSVSFVYKGPVYKHFHERPKLNASKSTSSLGGLSIGASLIAIARTSFRAAGSGILQDTPDATVQSLEVLEEDLPGIKHCNLIVQQGELVVLAGRRGHGKSTLLKILGGVLLPDSGEFFVPPHLRIVHVVQSPLFFRCSLAANLRYGLEVNDVLGKIDRLVKVCRRLHASDVVMELILTDQEKNWDENLSTTQKACLHLARALIANPEVLAIHKPTLSFDDTTSDAVMDAFKCFVRQRGVDVEGDPVLRRVRTCVVTASGRRGCAKADKIYIVEKTKVSAIPFNDVTEEMFD